MSTQFTNRQWRLPNEENKSKVSNYSMSFGGTQYIDAGTGLGDSLGTYTGDASISLWFKANTTTSNDGLFSITPFNGSYFGSLRISIYNNDLYFSGNSTNGSAPVNYKYTSFSDTTNWHHVVCIFKSGDITNSKIYIDGIDQTTTDVGTFASSLSLTGFKTIIGAYRGTVNTFNGSIDAVSIFDYALTDGTGGTVNQIATLYGSSSTGIGNPMSLSPKPIAYYPLGDQDAFNGADYLVPNSSLKDYVFDFDGSEIDISTITLANDFTISAWVTNTVSGSGNDQLLSAGSGFFIYSTAVRNGGANAGKMTYYNGSALIAFTDVIRDDTWHHVSLTYNSSTTTLTGYTDGNQTYSGTYDAGTNNQINKIGDNLYSHNWLGKLSNVQIFNTALPATGSNSVETLYNNGSPLTSMSGFTSLQGWWKLDASATYDSSTTTWTIPDDSTNSNDGTSSGMTQANLVQSDLSFTSGYSPYALDFDGANDYIDFNSIDLGTTNTISFWHKRGNTTSNQNIIGSLDGTQNNIVYFTSGYIYVRPDGSTQFITAYLGNTPYPFAPYKNTTDWANYIITRSGDNIKLYLNGVEFALSGSGSGMAATTVNRIGTKGNSVTNTIDGSISNVSVWNTALTQAQVTEIYSEGIPQNLNNHSAVSSLVSWWQLGSNSSFNTNWTVLDEVAASGNSGTSVNMTEADIVDGVGSSANGVGTSGLEVVGSAPFSDANSLSVNMDVLDRVEDTPS